MKYEDKKNEMIMKHKAKRNILIMKYENIKKKFMNFKGNDQN